MASLHSEELQSHIFVTNMYWACITCMELARHFQRSMNKQNDPCHLRAFLLAEQICTEQVLAKRDYILYILLHAAKLLLSLGRVHLFTGLVDSWKLFHDWIGSLRTTKFFTKSINDPAVTVLSWARGIPHPDRTTCTNDTYDMKIFCKRSFTWWDLGPPWIFKLFMLYLFLFIMENWGMTVCSLANQ